MSKLEELENSLKSPVQINIMHRIDNVLFSHGGLTADFLGWLNKDLLDADIEEVIAAETMLHMIISGMMNHPYGSDHSMRPERYSEQIYTNRW